MIEGYRISNNREDLDVKAIHSYISRSYWAKGIPLETLSKAINNSLCFGVFSDSGKQVGFARMITDYATFAYLADVYIDEAHRGFGLAKWLMKQVHSHSDLLGLRRLMLATKDAHGLYAQYGYSALNEPAMFMENWNPEVYSASKETSEYE